MSARPLLPPPLVPPEPTLAEQVARAIPPVPPEHEAIAASLEQHARRLRDLGRHGATLVERRPDQTDDDAMIDAYWSLADDLVVLVDRVDELGHATARTSRDFEDDDPSLHGIGAPEGGYDLEAEEAEPC